MKIDKLTLNNFQNYDSEEITFDSGVSLFYGVNGSGKSSILRAIFAGLFQSSACAEIPSGGRFKIEDFRRNGTNTGSVELEFTHNSKNYTVFWKFSDQTEACRFYEEDILVAESTREVGEAIRDLINMDSEAFVNSTYVQQTELMRMITSKKDERKKVFDSLLGIDTIEEYIDRAHNSEMGVKDAVKQIRTQLKSLENQISDLPPVDELNTDISQTDTQITKKQQQVEKLSDQLSDLEDTIEEYKDSIDEKEELSEEQTNVEDELTEQQQIVEQLQEECVSLNETLTQKQAELEELVDTSTYLDIDYQQTDSLDSLTTHITELQSETITDTERSVYQKCTEYLDESVDSSQMDNPSETIQRINSISRAEELVLPETTDELLINPANIVSSYTKLQETLRTEISRKTNQIEQKQDQLEDKQKYLEKLLSGSDSEIALQASFWNPIMNQNELEFQQSISQNSEELYEQIDSQLQSDVTYENLSHETNLLYSALLNEQSNTQEEIDTVREDIETLTEEIETLTHEKQQLETELQEVTEIESSIQQFAEYQMWKLEQKQQTLERKKEISELCQLYDEATSIEEQYEDKESQLERENNRITDLEEELETVTSDLKDVETKLQIDPDKIRTKIEKVEQKRDEIQAEIPDLQAQKSKLQTNKERRIELKSEISSYEDRLGEIEKTKQELSEVQSVYEQVRQTFREQFVEGINEYANDIFRNVYRNDRYQRIELDKEYGITIYTQNGTTIEPDLSSGGEAALINMTIRAAIYRVVSDMNLESEDPLPPIILDEPTTYLDEGHIEQLGSFVDTLESWNIEQIFIVSHNESLKQRCDKTYNVQINPQTGFSMVT